MDTACHAAHSGTGFSLGALEMVEDSFPENLRLLCSYAHSITEVCEKLSINRQQFHRYLNGKSRPSHRNLRNICDFFGVELHEIFMEKGNFSTLISLRSPRGPEIDPFGNFIAKLHRVNPNARRDMAEYIGYYRCYFRQVEFPGMMQCSLMRMFADRGFVYIWNIENYGASKRRARNLLFYTGIAFHNGERIMVHEREKRSGQMMWTSILYPSRMDQASLMTGLSLGVSSAMSRDIACYRVVWEALGPRVDVRSEIRKCGLISLDDPSIPSDILAATRNDSDPEDQVFTGRPWDIFTS
ncbi:helix-turn-helix transcriptional regulator [Sulfitobacter sp. DSM 110093]|uniref:helix-turn-helix domain-containing protein n=1 Tax=Sulfitobacter sp. DSM 110093 TaxID=2883127 RepID=UPI001FABF310|nr:helix-turn-helix transcriptional regulator [Sulfitobacter sp. DSM 110093]